jgi:threonine/homoserine/homoserine lactone efflux protein
VVARNAVALSRRNGLATAVGMGIGSVCFSGIALAGLYSLLSRVEWLYVGLKVAGGAYLLYLAVKIWRGEAAPLSIDPASPTTTASLGSSFRTGLSTQLTNPKTAIVDGRIFAAPLPQTPPLWCYIALPPLVFAVECG